MHERACSPDTGNTCRIDYIILDKSYTAVTALTPVFLKLPHTLSETRNENLRYEADMIVRKAIKPTSCEIFCRSPSLVVGMPGVRASGPLHCAEEESPFRPHPLQQDRLEAQAVSCLDPRFP